MKTKEFKNTQKKASFNIGIGEKTTIEEVSNGVIKLAYKRTVFGSKDPVGTGKLEVTCNILNAEGQKNVNAAKHVVLDSDVPLLILSCNRKRGNSIDLVVDKTNEIPFTVSIQHEALQDCIDRRIKSFRVKYTVSVKMDKDTESKTVSDTITINLEDIKCEPKISLADKKINYESGIVKTQLVFENSSTLAYAPTFAVRPTKIYLEKANQNKGTNSLSDIVTIDCSGAESGGINKDYRPYNPKDIVILGANEKNVNSEYIDCIFPHAGYEMNAPLHIDLNKLENPKEKEEEYTLVIEYTYWTREHADDPSSPQIKKITFLLIRNDEKNEMVVEISDRNVMRDRVNGEHYALRQPIDITATNANGGLTYNFTIAIKNNATVQQSAHPEAGIDICNLKIGDLTLDHAAAFTGQNSVATQNYAKKIIGGKKTSNGNVRLKPNEAVTIGITINTGSVNRFISDNRKDIFDVNLRQNISFDYFVNNTGKDTPVWTRWDGSVLFALQIPPKSEWLGVDFGTSAVVALYGPAQVKMRTNNRIQNLAVIKKKILEAAYGKGNGYAETTDEKTFINSNIVLGNGGKLIEKFSYDEQKGKATTNYKEGIVLFSPGDQIDYNNLLPPLKSMMGHKFIPIDNTMLVDDVYETAYHQLFDLYLSRVSNGQPIEKIVMTYPNTFAVSHVAKLREMAKNCIPTLRDDYIYTVSESDAIAYRYLLHQIRKKPANQLGFDRRILVYDMGAGTLDLTYFTNNTNNKVHEIDIVGKYGISKAGNYLDYVLAEIIAEICKKNQITIGGFNFDKAISYQGDRGDEIGNSFQLKNYVKNVLKPAMAKVEDPNKLTDDDKIPSWNLVEKLHEIPLKEIFNDSRFKGFIKEISYDVINGFRQNIGEFEVDVIVFSGRMTQFMMIRNAVLTALGESKTYTVDITDGKGGDALKASVVEGAVNFVEYFLGGNEFRILPQRPFYCNYAVIASVYDESELYCLINNRTLDYTATETINFNRVNKICLIQTYASNREDILRDFDNNRDLTTILSELDTSNYNGDLPVTIKVEIDDRETLQQGTRAVTLMIDAGEVYALPQENLDSVSFRKSSWPVIFD